MKFYATLLVILIPFLGCGSGDKNEPVVTPTSITLNKTEAVITINQTVQLTATIIPYNTATWTSSNPLVATVSPAGLVTAVSKGIVDIMVTAKETSATCKVVIPGGSPDFSWLVVGEAQGRAMVWTDKGNYDLGIGIARSVDKSVDGTIFVAGESEGLPAVWGGDDFTKRVLSNNKGKGNFVYLKDDDVYVAGQLGQQAVYWKNGVTNVLLSPSSGKVMLNSEAKSIAVTSSNMVVVGSGEFSRLGSYIPENGKIQSGMQWKLGFTYASTGEILSGGELLSNYLSFDITKSTNDDSIIVSGSTQRKSIGGTLEIIGEPAGVRFDFYDDNKDFYTYDIIPYNFKTVTSKDNSVLIATSIGLYKMTQVPNKAYLQIYGGLDGSLFQETLLPGYGYSRSVKLLNNNIYAAGHNIIYKNGDVFVKLSPTAEIYCLLVQETEPYDHAIPASKSITLIPTSNNDGQPNLDYWDERIWFEPAA